jgi:hypothetical protein
MATGNGILGKFRGSKALEIDFAIILGDKIISKFIMTFKMQIHDNQK